MKINKRDARGKERVHSQDASENGDYLQVGEGGISKSNANSDRDGKPKKNGPDWIDYAFELSGLSATIFENTKGSYRIFRTLNRFSPKYYPNMGGAGQRQVGFGIKTFSVKGTGIIVSRSLVGLSISLELNRYINNEISTGEFFLNSGIELYGLTGVGTVPVIFYKSIDTFYPGGVPGAINQYDRLEKANQKLLGPSFKLIPTQKW